ncbi:MAG: thiosulfate sulfurtransferase GlpE [Pseudomonadota bacterium]|nr:thiosulfate sulfurtransferase GlpE [Pseudomonas sp.]MEC8442737.1 thiosulfate sulfurtransferase GlpE [Pseudomonadota bacterium]
MSFTCISANDAKALLDNDDLSIADIRDGMAYAMGHIKGASHVDNSSLEGFMAHAAKDAPLLVCCYHGNSSKSAADFFADQGYQEVYSLDGGYEMWKVVAPELCDV